MARVSRRPLAAVDILDIWDYIAEDTSMRPIAGSTGWTRSSTFWPRSP